jgi:pimeloyl-ACP methyl ester carboxylesterase
VRNGSWATAAGVVPVNARTSRCRWRPASAADYRAVPGARVEWLPGVGHSPILEDPPRTAAFLLAFSSAHAARPD